MDRRLIGRIANGAAGGLVVALAIFVSTWLVDDRREERSQNTAAELAWRQSLTIGAEFPGADVSGLNLSGLYATDVDLSGGAARGTDLSHASLTGSRLDAADFSNALLTAANLEGASLVGADLSGADLSEAIIDYADFRAANLQGVDLTGVLPWRADVRGADLTDASLPERFALRACWDQETRWPDGFEPRGVLCLAVDPPDDSGPKALQYGIDLVGGLAVEDDDNQVLADTVEVEAPGQIVAVLRFRNLGRVQARGVKVLFEQNPAVLKVVEVRLFTDSFPDGTTRFEPNPVQQGGAVVNVDAGNYAGEGNFYLRVTYEVRNVSCDPSDQTITAYLQPERYGSLSQTLPVAVRSATDCPTNS